MTNPRTFPTLFLLTFLVLLIGGLVAAAEIRPRIEIDRPVIVPEIDNEIYVRVDLDIPDLEIDVAPRRPPLNIALVIDRSGSMQDRGKIDYAIRAAHILVDQLSPRDRLAVVEYDDRISVLVPSQRVRSKHSIKDRISGLYPRGATNLTGGMMEGVYQVMGNEYRHGINRVLLLSDGLANRGVVSPYRIREMVRDARRQGVTITTLGLGLDFNEDLMQNIAEHSGGRYYFIESPRQMVGIFEQELGTMFAAVASDVRATIRLSDDVDDCSVFGYPFERHGRDITIDLGNLHAGEKTSLVMKLKLNEVDRGRHEVGNIQLNYNDITDKRSRVYKSAIEIEATSDRARAEKSKNEDVGVEAALVEADEFQAEQTRLVEQGRYKEARANIAAFSGKMADLNSDIADVRLEKKIEELEVETEQIEEAAVSSESRSRYLKSAKFKRYNALQGRRQGYLIMPGDKGAEVEKLQKALREAGYFSGKINGRYTDELTDALKKFQTANGLDSDGVAGPKTLSELGLY